MTDTITQLTDVLVVGAGGAGARAAIAAAERGCDVLLAAKGPLARSGITPLAQWSLEAALGHEDERDSPWQHFLDIVREGRFLSDQNLAEVLANEAPERVRDLDRYGTRFRKRDGKFRQFATPGQTYPRSVYLEGGGHGLMMGLRKEVLRHSHIRLWEDACVTRILVQDRKAVGATVLDLRAGRIHIVLAKAIVLATGGNEELWPVSDCPPESVGDGMWLAMQAGAELVDMEMMLYYPLVGCWPSSIRGTIIPYEVTLDPERCAGKLVNARGEEFLPPGPLPARDIIIAAMFREIREGRGTERGGLFLDLTRSPKGRQEVERVMAEMLPDVLRYLRNAGVDPVAGRVEVAPAAHYTLGGIRIDERCQTTVPGLFAAGEVAGNVQGANRSSGNALTETQVFGARAGWSAAEFATENEHVSEVSVSGQVGEEIVRLERYISGEAGVRPQEIKRGVKETMGRYVGFGRDAEGLRQAMELLADWERQLDRMRAVPVRQYNRECLEAIEVAAMVRVARAVAQAALARTESRGHHYRFDYPERDDKNWLRHTVVTWEDGELRLRTEPVVVTKVRIPFEESERQ